MRRHRRRARELDAVTTSDWSAALMEWLARDDPDEREHDLLVLGARATVALFVENHNPRGDLRRWSVLGRLERAQRIRRLTDMLARAVK